MSSEVESKNEMVLIDSDSDNCQGEYEPSRKRTKMGTTEASDSMEFDIEHEVKLNIYGGSGMNSSDGEDLSGKLIVDSSSTRVGPDETGEENSTYNAECDSDSGDSELDAISGDESNISSNETIPSKSSIAETRKYLKENGTMKFLEKYLPLTASSEDITQLIFRLGFLPRDIPHFQEDDKLLGIIKLLHSAMKKVSSMRSRLDNFCTVEQVLQKISSSEKILVITGAGISTSLGIPDFRSSQGFYSKLQNLGLSDPQEVFDVDFFHTDPSIFYSIAHMILPPDNAYTPLHNFIRVLQDKGKLLRNYTQNIDNLEENAGINEDKVVQCHGSFATASCVTCRYRVKGEDIYTDIRNKEVPLCPKCLKMRTKLMNNDESYVPESYGVMKPDITFFGEALPSKFHDLIKEDLFECDLVLAIGTSLKVAPVADIVTKIPPDVPQLLINKDPITHCSFDVSLLGYCDDIASYLSSKLSPGWELEHPDWSKIVGSNGSNLELRTISEEDGMYSIVNLEKEAKEKNQILEAQNRKQIVPS